MNIIGFSKSESIYMDNLQDKSLRPVAVSCFDICELVDEVIYCTSLLVLSSLKAFKGFKNY